MILLDTHVWFWWVQGDARLSTVHQSLLTGALPTQVIAVSAFSCWEIAMLAQKGRINLSLPVLDWLHLALTPSAVRLMPITPAVAVESANLPGDFHSDPADQIIVATARIEGALLLTQDAKILAYPHVSDTIKEKDYVPDCP